MNRDHTKHWVDYLSSFDNPMSPKTRTDLIAIVKGERRRYLVKLWAKSIGCVLMGAVIYYALFLESCAQYHREFPW
jgi:hypothetical protein